MRVYVKHPGCPWKEMNIGGSLEDLQALVGGNIETVPLLKDELLFANEEGRIYDLPENRVGHYTYYGTVFLVGVDGEEFTDAPKMDISVLNNK